MNANKNIIDFNEWVNKERRRKKLNKSDYSPELQKALRDIKISKDGQAYLDLSDFPHFMPHLVFCFCAWENYRIEIISKNYKGKSSQSESIQRELANKINHNLDNNRYAMRERPVDENDDCSNWPLNVMDLSNWLIVYDVDNQWKEIGDFLITEFNVDVCKLCISSNGKYYRMYDMRNPQYWILQAKSAWSSYSHQVFFVKRDDDKDEAA